MPSPGQSVAPRSPQVWQAVEELEEVAKAIATTIGTLTVRLEPVLSPALLGPQGRPETLRGPEVPLAVRLRAATAVVSESIQEIAALRDRLEI